MNNITFGQYVPGNSWIYKVDPRTKIILTIALIVLIFLIPNILAMAVALGIFLVVFLTTRISLLKVIKGIKPVLFLLLFTSILQLIYTVPTKEALEVNTFWELFYTTNKDKELMYVFKNMQIGLYQTLAMIGILALYIFTKKFMPLKFLWLLICLFGCFMMMWYFDIPDLNWATWDFKVYQVGLENAGVIFLRIVLMIGITSLLTLTTMSTDINNGIEAVLAPLKLIKVPVGVFAMLISLTLRFIPTLLAETQKIMNAQASRGVDFHEGKLKDKVNQIISLLIPMFVISFKRAEELSDAMEARGYIVGGKRTKLDELKMNWRDILSFIFVVGLFTAVIWYRIYVQV